MHYLNITEYQRHFNVSRPTIYSRIEAGLLHTLQTEDGRKVILVEDTEYTKVKGK